MNKLLFVFIYLLINSAVFAQKSNTYAVVIGISDYQSLNYTNGDLRYADTDAQQFVDFLKSNAGGKISTVNIVTLINAKATKLNIKKAFAIFEKANSNDKIWFYFSGHGLEQGLVPYDVVRNQSNTLLSFAEIKQAFKASKASTKIFVADACQAGSMTVKSSKQTTKKLADISPSTTNIALIFSARSSQSAVEEKRLKGGVFTYFLLKGLYGEADRDDNKVVTIKELFQYVSPKVKKNTANHQTPLFYGKFVDNLILSNL